MILHHSDKEFQVLSSPSLPQPVPEPVQVPLKISRMRIGLLVIAAFVVLSFIILLVAVRENPLNLKYAQPVSGPLELSANFAEIRPDHWHMGLDIRTAGRENMPVRSVADGFVSRISVSANGYGNAIYVQHAGNRTSVYAHLNDFFPLLQHRLEQMQLKSESWEQDLVFKPGEFPVSKGMYIAASGNTGHSEGPHLHFEWRNTLTGTALNPQAELFMLDDDLPPVIEEMLIYDRGTTGEAVALFKIANPRSVIKDEIMVTSPFVSIGIVAVDKMTSSQFNLGIYSTEVYEDDRLIYRERRDSVSDIDNREINGMIDYNYWYNHHVIAGHLFRAAANEIDLAPAQGTIDLGDGRKHRIRVRISDLRDNFTSVEMDLRYTRGKVLQAQKNSYTSRNNDHAPNIFAGRKSVVSSGNFLIEFPKGSLFNDLFFNAAFIQRADPLNLSGTISLYDGQVPLRDSVILYVKPLVPVERVRRQQAVLVISNKNFYDVVRGNWNANIFSVKIGNLGSVALMYDSLPPVIGLSGWRNRGKVGAGGELKLIATDNLNRIAAFRAEIDGHWVPFSRKNNWFRYQLPARLTKGDHSLKVEVSDIAGNITRNTFHFQY